MLTKLRRIAIRLHVITLVALILTGGCLFKSKKGEAGTKERQRFESARVQESPPSAAPFTPSQPAGAAGVGGNSGNPEGVGGAGSPGGGSYGSESLKMAHGRTFYFYLLLGAIVVLLLIATLFLRGRHAHEYARQTIHRPRRRKKARSFGEKAP